MGNININDEKIYINGDVEVVKALYTSKIRADKVYEPVHEKTNNFGFRPGLT